MALPVSPAGIAPVADPEREIGGPEELGRERTETYFFTATRKACQEVQPCLLRFAMKQQPSLLTAFESPKQTSMVNTEMDTLLTF